VNLKKTRLKDWVNPLKWYSFAKSKFIHFFLKKHVVEQIMFRMLSCPQCVREGSCVVCGCNTFEKMLNPSETDSNGLWGPIKNKKEWKAYKEKFSIDFKLTANFN